MTDHRYPIEPLADTMHDTIHGALKRLGVSGSTQTDYRARGLTRKVAERLANRIGRHPAEIWPEIIDHDIADISRPCEECGELFIPVNAIHRFCHRDCQSRSAARRRYRNDPAFRARELERVRRHHAETADYRRAQRRRRYQQNGEAEREASRRRYWADPERHRKRTQQRRQAAARIVDETTEHRGAA